MKNPLRKRLPRELKSELGKYLVIFLFMTGTIGFVSGFLVADGSMLKAYEDSFEKYKIEDGNFELAAPADRSLTEALEKENLTLYNNFYIEEETGINHSILRMFKNRTKVNQVCVMKGTLPADKKEIAIDRMYADNNDLVIGDTIEVGKERMTISGLVALSDYSTMFSNNSDMMFDATMFGVAIVSKDGFASYGKNKLHYSYSWVYDRAPENDIQAKKKGDDVMQVLRQHTVVLNFIPEYDNQAIHFTGEDMGSDKAMMIALLYILIAILAFVFAVTESNTVNMESRTIGTLRASGYFKGELVRHYMTMPLIVTVAAAIVGNMLGYTYFKNLCVALYYGSYSLPTYVTIWNAEAFLLTTMIPLIIMLAINGLILIYKLSLSPLQFLRVDLSRRKKKRAITLPNMKFFSRFRIRIILQNRVAYSMLFIGILFANLLLMFGLVFPSMLDHYQKKVEEGMIAKYQYILKTPAETEKKAEKYAVCALETTDENCSEITVYGIQSQSSYLYLAFEEDGIYISEGIAEKFSLHIGDTITLKEQYGKEEYTFEITGIYDYPAALSIFMNRKEFNRTFDKEKGYFNGYFSNNKLTDIDDAFIASIITEDDLTKLSRQLQLSMGDMMDMIKIFAVLMFVLLIYLLSKIVIEKNASNISMVKILGFYEGEISRLYILSTAVVVVGSILISLPAEYYILYRIFYGMIMPALSGWFSYYVAPEIYVKMIVVGLISYGVVALAQYRNIKKVPMEEALKNAE